MIKSKHVNMYLRIAEAVAQTSSAKRLQVGAVAVKDNKVIGSGYNALPSGIDGDCENKEYDYEKYHYLMDGSQKITDETLEWLKRTYPYEDEKGFYRLHTKPEVRHAEANLLLNLARSTESSDGCIVFCTHACCKFCAHDLVDAGIKEFYYKHDYRNTEGLDYLRYRGVAVHKIEEKE